MRFGRKRTEAPPLRSGSPDSPDDVRGRPAPSRIGNLWVVSISLAVVLLLLLIFILQNGQKVEISYLGARGRIPMGVALLLAAIFGILLVALPGSARIMQLRIRDRRRRLVSRKQAVGKRTGTPTPAARPEPEPTPGVSSVPPAESVQSSTDVPGNAAHDGAQGERPGGMSG